MTNLRSHLRPALFTLLVVATMTVVALSRSEASAATVCSKVASPSGSDSAAGTPTAPFRTAQKLADSLSAGESGCLRSGRYVEDLKISHGGTADGRVTLTSYPGERAQVVGRMWVARGADYFTVSGLELNGLNSRRLPSPTVNANYTRFENNDVTNGHTSICFVLGSSYGSAGSPVLDGNRIHDCGRLPSTNYDHGVYVEEATDAKITNNLIYDNADRGIQLYPNAQGTLIRGNVIDGNGEGIIFSGAGSATSNDTTVEHNIITNSKLRYNVESYYSSGTPIGRRNVVRENCISGGTRDRGNGGVQSPNVGFSTSGTVVSNPQFVDRDGKDFRLQPGSPCEAVFSTPVAASSDSSQRPRLALKSRERSQRAGKRVLVRGRVSGVSATTIKRMTGKRVVIQIRRSNGWKLRGVGRLDRRGQFSQRLVVGRTYSSPLFRLRATLGAGLRSNSVDIRVRR